MSLIVPSHVLDKVSRDGVITHGEFIRVVRSSLPALWSLCERAQQALTESGDRHSVIREEPCVGGDGYAQVLRGMASTSIHAALDAEFGGKFFLLETGVFAFFGRDVVSGEEFSRYFHRVLHSETAHVCGDDRSRRLAQSHPLAYARLERLAERIRSDGIAVDAPLHMDDVERVQLLELMAVHLNRRGIEWAFGQVELGFVNCHVSTGTQPKKRTPSQRAEWERLTSPVNQILQQSPLLRDC